MRKPGAVLLAAPIALGELVGTLIARSRVLRVVANAEVGPASHLQHSKLLFDLDGAHPDLLVERRDGERVGRP